MFCSLLSTFQMSCKSTPCQWSAHVPLLIFRQLSAQLSPGYRDSKFSPCLCCLSPKSFSLPVPQGSGSLFLTYCMKPFQSTLLKSELCGSSALTTPSGCCCSASCGGTQVTNSSDYKRLCFGGCLVGQMHAAVKHAKQISGFYIVLALLSK